MGLRLLCRSAWLDGGFVSAQLPFSEIRARMRRIVDRLDAMNLLYPGDELVKDLTMIVGDDGDPVLRIKVNDAIFTVWGENKAQMKAEQADDAAKGQN